MQVLHLADIFCIIASLLTWGIGKYYYFIKRFNIYAIFGSLTIALWTGQGIIYFVSKGFTFFSMSILVATIIACIWQTNKLSKGEQI
ncbi:MAG: hypothetical protein Q8934_19070 [Bacillota bacterium]|nr:hypothetical protein [Bacillota bacterium]